MVSFKMELSKWSKWKMVNSHEIISLEKWNGQMDKMENGPLTTLKEYMEFPRSSEGLHRRWV